MANQLKMAIIDSILALHLRHWSQRRIARELGINRETVSRYLQQAADLSKPAIAPTGSAAEGNLSKPAIAPTGSPGPQEPPADLGRGRPSLCEPWRPIILAKLEAGLTAQRIYQDLVTDHGFTGKYPSVRRFVRRLGQGRPLPFRRLECAAGEEAQVDFGSGALLVLPDGKRKRTHVFRLVLSHSRKGYSEAVYRQTTEEFIRCLENAFWDLGGVPKVLVLDNLKAAVEHADWFDPDLNPKMRSFAAHYGLAVLPTRPRTPRHKGKTESGVGYVKGNGLKGHVFSSLEEENRHLQHWETTVADTRIHGTTRQQVGKLFAEVERPALQPLPPERFPFFHEGQRSVHRDGHIEVAKAYYSVPPEYLGRRVWVRWDGRVVRIFNDRLEPIAVHVQVDPGRFSTQGRHIPSAKISAVERGAAWMLTKIQFIGGQAAAWGAAVMEVRGIEGIRVLQGLVSLAQRHPVAMVENACAKALSYGSYRLRTIRALLKHQGPKQEQFAFLDEHPLIRSLDDYAALVHAALSKETGP
jgi:transposase